MLTTSIKRGRKPRPYTTTWGETIVGLSRRPSDGRWRVVSTGFTYTESDERLAVARFCAIRDKETGDAVDIPTTHATLDDAAEAFVNRRVGNDRTYLQFEVDVENGEPVTKQIEVANWQPSAAVWAWFREQILTQPKFVAKMTGIEQIGYLTDVERPTVSPKLAGLIDYYAVKPNVSAEEITRCRRFWVEFVKIVGVVTLREIKHEHVEAYEKKLAGMALSPKSIKHRYTRVKTVIAHAMKRGKAVADCRAALDKFSILEVPEGDTLDPSPIRAADFWKVHAAAVKAENHSFVAMMLFSLNCALYPSEAGAVKWDDVDLARGEFVTRRNKTKVPRLAVLWPETIAAIKALPRVKETIFNTARMRYQRASAFRDWSLYREAAGLPDVKFAQIRDAAFTSACRLNLDQARVLAGHRLPGSVDNYVMRSPQFVAPACEAIRAEYVLTKPTTKAPRRAGKA